MSDLILLRDRLDVAERRFAVYGEPWFDPQDAEWRGRLLFLPLDRSLPRAISTDAERRSRRRESLIEELRGIGDRELRRTLVLLALARSHRQ